VGGAGNPARGAPRRAPRLGGGLPLTKATTRAFFFGGTLLFTAVFVALTIHTHATIAERTHADRLSAEVARGFRVWERYNCENCHTLLGEGAYFAPDLTKIVSQRGKAYLSAFLADPSRFYSEDRDGRLMPTLGLSAPEISDVLDFLAWVGEIDTNGWPPRPILVSGVAARGLPGVEGHAAAAGPAERGRATFEGKGACASCHSLSEGATLVGPSLAGIASRAGPRVQEPEYTGAARSAEEYLRESVLEPNAYVVAGERYGAPGASLMPSHYASLLAPSELDDLVAFLATQK
jgi:nitric oxide reductase subunit C